MGADHRHGGVDEHLLHRVLVVGLRVGIAVNDGHHRGGANNEITAVVLGTRFVGVVERDQPQVIAALESGGEVEHERNAEGVGVQVGGR